MLEAFILKYSTEYGIDSNLIRAVIAVESGGRALCMRYEPRLHNSYSHKADVVDDAKVMAGKTNVSYDTELVLRASSLGAMQVLGQVARELGHKGPLTDLCNPDIGLRFGVMKLKQLSDRYHGLEQEMIAAYNAGSALRNPTGKYINQEYVDRVSLELTRLRAHAV